MSNEQDKKVEKVIITEVKKVQENLSAQTDKSRNFERVNTVDSSLVKKGMESNKLSNDD